MAFPACIHHTEVVCGHDALSPAIAEASVTSATAYDPTLPTGGPVSIFAGNVPPKAWCPRLSHSPIKGLLLWDPALITHCLASSGAFYFCTPKSSQTSLSSGPCCTKWLQDLVANSCCLCQLQQGIQHIYGSVCPIDWSQ